MPATETLLLARTLIDEMVGAVGLPKMAAFQKLFWSLFGGLMIRFAELGLTFDRLVASSGLPKASQWALSFFCHPAAGRGLEHIPPDGPLLVTSNHPGAYDALVIFSHLNRPDIRWISSEIPFLDNLPHTRQHIIFASRVNAAQRTAALRAAIRHLRGGGALLYFGAGHRDPDPAVYAGAAQAMEAWLPGIDFFFRHVPGLRLLPTVVSGVISTYWARHPITWLRRKQIDQQRLSEFGQVISQLLRPGRLMLTPRLSFGPGADFETLQAESSPADILPAVIRREKALLAEHMQSAETARPAAAQ
ncbi:MAG: 1-acyl-sn-glycerol-3-phosphate acyltransferase [Anaerolineales bacterium]